MSYLVIDAMQEHGTQFLMQCVPTKIEKDESGKLKVTWKDANNHSEVSDTFDTIMMAVGK